MNQDMMKCTCGMQRDEMRKHYGESLIRGEMQRREGEMHRREDGMMRREGEMHKREDGMMRREGEMHKREEEASERRQGKEYAMSFAAWELRLYLDTHPCDERALAAFRKLCAANSNGKCNYACAGTDCGCEDEKRWCWIDDPWPWEPEANETEDCR